MPTPEQHALLSASSSARWLNCPPSARLSESFPQTTSQYAEAGRVAHAIAELKARKYFVEPMSARTYSARLKKLKEDPNYEKGMGDATDVYLEHLKTLTMSYGIVHPFVALETRVDFGEYVPEGFGTADCIIIGADRMCVVDYKNGSGVPVEAEANTQMMLYALGALKVYGPIYGDAIQQISLNIVQPNAGGVKDWSLSRTDLEDWGRKVVKPLAAQAWEGGGEYLPGDWCRFCPARAQCTARAKKMLELEPMKGAVPAEKLSEGEMLSREFADGCGAGLAPLLTDAQVGDVLARGRELVAWVKDLEAYALTAALEGREISGFKVVEGRGSREWVDLDSAFAALARRGVAEAMLWERKPISVAGLEKAMGKKNFSETAEDLVIKKPGKPALVPESDLRKPYDAAAVAFKAVSPNG